MESEPMNVDSSSSQYLEYTRDTLSKFKVSKEFQESDKPVTSISFNDTGEFCATAGADDSLNVYHCLDGTLHKTLFSKKYGCTLARFTHADSNLIYASTKENDTLRYLSIYDNKYIRYFPGHKKRVVAIDVCPIDDMVLSSSLDNTVRLWDLRSSNCQGVLHAEGTTLAAFDPQGVVFSTVSNNNTVRFYDKRDYTKGPFITSMMPESVHGRLPEITSVKFTSDGNYVVVTTLSDTIFVLDAFNGNLVRRLVGNSPPEAGSCGEEVSMTPDGKFLMAGGSDSYLRIWDLTYQGAMDIKPFAVLPTPHSNGVKVVGQNHANAMFVTGANKVALWIP